MAFLLGMLCTYSNAQTTIYYEDFDTPDTDMSTYQLYDGGNNPVPFNTTGTDYIQRATPGSLPMIPLATGFSGKTIRVIKQ